MQTKKHLPELDIARAIFAWWVVGCHTVINSGVPWNGGSGFIEKTLLQASWAVNGFLILSGFVMAKLIIERGEGYGAYLTRRFFRLYPVFIVCLIPSIFLFERQPIGWFIGSLASHFTLLHGMVPESASIGPVGNECFAASILPPAWSISLEWQYYLLAPFFVSWLWRAPTRTWLLVAFICYLPICTKWGFLLNREWPLQSFLPLKLIYFFGGVCAYRAWPNGAATLHLPAWTRCLQWLGKVSYSTYLVHWPVLVLLALCFKPLLADKSSQYQSVVLFAFGSPIIIGLSALLYTLVEKPGIGWGRQLITRNAQTVARAIP